MITVHIVAAVGARAVEMVGAYAGFAAVAGLGVLSLLYFSQAREVKRLREWAGRAPERAVEIEQRVQADAQRRVVAQPLAPATIAAQTDAARQAAAAAQLYAKLPPPPPPPTPLVGPPGQLARPSAPAATTPAAGVTTPEAGGAPNAGPAPTPAATPGTGVPAAAKAEGPGAVPGSAPPPSAPGSATAVPGSAPPPMTAAAAAAAASRQAIAASRTVVPAGSNGGGQDTRESAAARPSPPPDLPEAPKNDDGKGGFSAARIGAILGGAVVAVLIGVVLMVSLTREDPKPMPNDFGTSPQAATPVQALGGTSSTPAATSSPARIDRGAVKVAVLNGTKQTGLAREVADKIERSGFTIGTVGNNADQRLPQTIVSYRAGGERAAQVVAGLIKVDRGSVQSIDATSSAGADADVVVTVGTDQIG